MVGNAERCCESTHGGQVRQWVVGTPWLDAQVESTPRRATCRSARFGARATVTRRKPREPSRKFWHDRLTGCQLKWSPAIRCSSIRWIVGEVIQHEGDEYGSCGAWRRSHRAPLSRKSRPNARACVSEPYANFRGRKRNGRPDLLVMQHSN